MASQSTETYDAFTRFGVPQLKDFLRKRDLPVSGRKAELVALAYAASLLKIPLVKTASERQAERQKQYEATLNVDDQQLPDPLLDLKSGWEDESVGMSKWPPTMITDIQTYLQKHETNLTCASLSKRLLKDYKEGKAFSYFSSLFLFEILYHKVTDDSPYCCLKSKCIPSQRIRDEPHTLWVIIDKESGEIKSSYCSCIAGLGRSCNHITAVLLKLDFCWKYGFCFEIKNIPTLHMESSWQITYSTTNENESNEMEISSC
ncbi:uncharacterized protein [Ptychodera flava]|uniref:uncharacterized protein n=1 Tax=Ptychodera flava TaxID=63121 RepID=UPI003969DAE9